MFVVEASSHQVERENANSRSQSRRNCTHTEVIDCGLVEMKSEVRVVGRSDGRPSGQSCGQRVGQAQGPGSKVESLLGYWPWALAALVWSLGLMSPGPYCHVALGPGPYGSLAICALGHMGHANPYRPPNTRTQTQTPTHTHTHTHTTNPQALAPCLNLSCFPQSIRKVSLPLQHSYYY